MKQKCLLEDTNNNLPLSASKCNYATENKLGINYGLKYTRIPIIDP